jgi:phasin family protein
MYDKVFKEAQENMKPLLDMVEINSQAVEKLVKQQADYMSEVLKAGLEHGKVVSEIKDPAAAVEAQKTFVEEMGKRLMEAAKTNMDVMVEAKDSLTKVVEASVKEVQSKVSAAK